MRNQPSQPGTLDEYAELMGSIGMPQGVRSAVMTEAHEAEGTPRRQAPKRRTTALRVIRLCRHPKGGRASWTAARKPRRTPSA